MFKFRGIIEGFYGKPWTHAERLVLLQWMGQNGYTHYMYAPKADTYHRTDWRKPYPEVEMARFRELIAVASAAQVSFGFAVSPGLSMRYSSVEDRQVLFEKVATFAKMGVTSFGIFFDDIPEKLHHAGDKEKFTSLAQAQVEVMNEFFRRLEKDYPGVEMIFCPTVYHGRGDEKYLQELGQGLNPAIQIFWTGPQICSRKIEVSDIQAVQAALRRKPVIWDNYPVNDGMMAVELHVGPFVGRSGELLQVADGFFMNPMNQFYASLLTLKAIGEYLMHPAEYNVVQAWEDGIEASVGLELAKDFMHFAEYNLVSPLHDPEMNLYQETWKKGDVKLIESEALAMRNLGVRLERGLIGTSLGVEIAPWLRDFLRLSEMALLAVEVQKRLTELMQKNPEEKEAIWAFIRLQRILNKLRRALKQALLVQTSVTGGVVCNYCMRIQRSVEMLLNIYVDKRGWHFREIRRILRRL